MAPNRPKVVGLFSSRSAAEAVAADLNARPHTGTFGVRRLEGYRRRPWAVSWRPMTLADAASCQRTTHC